jgi:hypothetical protein
MFISISSSVIIITERLNENFAVRDRLNFFNSTNFVSCILGVISYRYSYNTMLIFFEYYIGLQLNHMLIDFSITLSQIFEINFELNI